MSRMFHEMPNIAFTGRQTLSAILYRTQSCRGGLCICSSIMVRLYSLVAQHFCSSDTSASDLAKKIMQILLEKSNGPQLTSYPACPGVILPLDQMICLNFDQFTAVSSSTVYSSVGNSIEKTYVALLGTTPKATRACIMNFVKWHTEHSPHVLLIVSTCLSFEDLHADSPAREQSMSRRCSSKWVPPQAVDIPNPRTLRS